jgi:hypothetical protein
MVGRIHQGSRGTYSALVDLGFFSVESFSLAESFSHQRKRDLVLMKVVSLALLLFALLFVIFSVPRIRSYFGGYTLGSLVNSDGVCSSHCVKNQRGETMDVYDCCNCKAITAGGQWTPYFRNCMCKAGYGNYCFREATNYLLSQ